MTSALAVRAQFLGIPIEKPLENSTIALSTFSATQGIDVKDNASQPKTL
jgi:hypothetical protein